MMGDDWLNNASTRDRYAAHVESELQREIEVVNARIAAAAVERGVQCIHRAAVGDPAECLAACAAEVGPDLIVIGMKRPRGAPGLRSRMDLEKLTGGTSAPLYLAPHPR